MQRAAARSTRALPEKPHMSTIEQALVDEAVELLRHEPAKGSDRDILESLLKSRPCSRRKVRDAVVLARHRLRREIALQDVDGNAKYCYSLAAAIEHLKLWHADHPDHRLRETWAALVDLVPEPGSVAGLPRYARELCQLAATLIERDTSRRGGSTRRSSIDPGTLRIRVSVGPAHTRRRRRGNAP